MQNVQDTGQGMLSVLREIVLFYPEVTRILCVEMIKSCKSSQHAEPSPVLQNRPLCYKIVGNKQKVS